MHQQFVEGDSAFLTMVGVGAGRFSSIESLVDVYIRQPVYPPRWKTFSVLKEQLHAIFLSIYNSITKVCVLSLTLKLSVYQWLESLIK